MCFAPDVPVNVTTTTHFADASCIHLCIAILMLQARPSFPPTAATLHQALPGSGAKPWQKPQRFMSLKTGLYQDEQGRPLPAGGRSNSMHPAPAAQQEALLTSFELPASEAAQQAAGDGPFDGASWHPVQPVSCCGSALRGLLPAACCLPPAACRLPPAACCLLPAACCLLHWKTL
jgi:hypothetical protein